MLGEKHVQHEAFIIAKSFGPMRGSHDEMLNDLVSPVCVYVSEEEARRLAEKWNESLQRKGESSYHYVVGEFSLS